MSITDAVNAKYVGGLSDEYTIREYGYTGEELDAEAARRGLVAGGNSEITDYIISDTMLVNAGNYSTAGLVEYIVDGGRTRAVMRSRAYDLGTVSALKNPDYTADKYKSEMRAFKKFTRDIINEYYPTGKVKIVNIGVKRGRMTQFLTREFGDVTGVVFDKALCDSLSEKFPDCKFVFSGENPNDISTVPEVAAADVVIYTRIFYTLDYTATFASLHKLKKKPLIIINEPNAYTQWEDPKLDKLNNLFDPAVYANTMAMLAASEKAIRSADLFTLLSFINQRELGANVFVLRNITLRVSKGMLAVGSFITNMAKKYLGKDTNVLRLLDVGTGIGRYALYLEHMFKGVLGIDNNDQRIEAAKAIAATKHSANKYAASDGETMFSVVKDFKPDVILFANSFHQMQFDEVLEQLEMLARKRHILVIIKQTNGHISMSVEELNAMSRAARYILDQSVLTVVEHVVDSGSASTLFALRN